MASTDVTQIVALMRPGVVWFGGQLDPDKIETVEAFLGRGPRRFDCRLMPRIVREAVTIALPRLVNQGFASKF